MLWQNTRQPKPVNGRRGASRKQPTNIANDDKIQLIKNKVHSLHCMRPESDNQGPLT
jgi:hypothetical protein